MKRRSAFLVLAVAASLNAGPSVAGEDQPLWIAQNVPPGFPIQPRPPDKSERVPTSPDEIAPPQSQPKKKFDAAGAQRNAQEIAALAQKIPAEVEQASKNVLSKDLIQQLKQIEKLAKRLRAQLSP